MCLATSRDAGIIRAADLQGAAWLFRAPHFYVLLQTDTPICWGLK